MPLALIKDVFILIFKTASTHSWLIAVVVDIFYEYLSHLLFIVAVVCVYLGEVISLSLLASQLQVERLTDD